MLYWKIHTKPHPGLEWLIFRIHTSEDLTISMISLISSLSLKLYLNSLLYDRNILGSSSKVFGSLWKYSEIFEDFLKMVGNVRLAFGTILENLRKSSESGRKSLENRQKRRHQNVLIKKEHYTLAGKCKFFVLVARTLSRSFAALTREILFLPLEHKIHIFSPPCNNLYLFW